MANFSVYTYEFIPLAAQGDLFNQDATNESFEEVKARKQQTFQKYMDMIADGTLIPKMEDKEYRCKVLYNCGGLMVFKIENIKDESFDWNFSKASHKIGPNCHVIIDNRKDMQHIAIERKTKAFSSPNVVKNILNATLKPLLKDERLLFDIKPQYQPKEFWDYIRMHREEGIREIRFYFPYPNLPAISDKYGDYMKQMGIDYNCCPGFIMYAPDDLDMKLEEDDPQMQFYTAAAGESGVPIAIKTKAKGAKTHYVGKASSIVWGMDNKIIKRFDPKPDEAESKQTKFEFADQSERELLEGKLTDFVNKGRFLNQ